MVSALDRKLLRDLWHMRGQALAIISIIASGLALFTGQLSTLESLKHTRDGYYANYRFADVFVSCKRAPNSLVERIRGINGVTFPPDSISLSGPSGAWGVSMQYKAATPHS